MRSRGYGTARGNRAAFALGLPAVGLLAVALALPAAAEAAGRVGDPFPEIQPSTRTEAIAYLAGSTDGPSLTPQILRAQRDALAVSPSIRRALSLLQGRVAFARELSIVAPDGTSIRYTIDPSAFDGIDATDRNGDGQADAVQAVLAGLEESRRLFGDELQLPAPSIEVILAEMGGRVAGYLVPATTGHRMVVDATVGAGPGAIRTAVVREYAHAVAVTINPRFSPEWTEAIGTWATSFEGPDHRTGALYSSRIARLAEGLVPQEGLADRDPVLSGGNGLWLNFLYESYGLAAVRATVEELGRGGPVAIALDRAVRRVVSGDNLAAAFREFHLWTILVGERDDEQHFSFAADLASPGFASDAEGLPALSVQTDPAIAPLGATQIRVRPDHTQGGLRVQFEGDFAARWEVDLVLLRRDGTKFRLPVSLTDGRADHTVPLVDLVEAWLLIRNLGSDGDGVRRYSYTAQHDRNYPFELTAMEAETAGDDTGVLVSWETAAEHGLFAYNVLRRREGGGQLVTVNPIWIPAMGDRTAATSYRFQDRSAKPGVAYIYTIEGITTDGLTSRSEPIRIRSISGPAAR